MEHVRFLVLILTITVASGSDAALCSKDSTATDIASGIDLHGQVAIVTGGDSGLGYSIAETFAKQGASVLIASHNLEKCQNAAQNISVSTGNVHVVGAALDLGTFASVRTFAAQFLKEHETLNYLFNNAGISHCSPPCKTGDGFEEVFQINYLSHFLLTELLLPALRKSAAQDMPARVVNTASSGHFQACVGMGAPQDCFKDFTYLPTPTDLKPIVYNGTTINASTYGVSKFAQVQHAAELAVRESRNGVKAFSVGPGLVVTAMTNVSGHPPYSEWCKNMEDSLGIHQEVCPYTAQEGAAVNTACALLAAKPGSWYTRYTDCSHDQPVVEQGFTEAMLPEFYRRSQQWVGLNVSSVLVV